MRELKNLSNEVSGVFRGTLEWFQRKGFPNGTPDTRLQTMYEIKLNGLEYLPEPLEQNRRQEALAPC
jgi:hypothetical protein